MTSCHIRNFCLRTELATSRQTFAQFDPNADDNDGAESKRILAELEHIDDECDQKGISFVKIDDDNVAKEYGVDHLPTLVYFENNVPSMFDGDLAVEEKVLEWLIHNVESDEIEDVTDEMLDTLIRKSTHLAVLFCRFFRFLKQIKQKTRCQVD